MSGDGSARLRELQAIQKSRGLSEAEWEEAALLLAAAGRPEEAEKALHRAARKRKARSTPTSALPTALPTADQPVAPAQREPRQGFRWWPGHGPARSAIEFIAQVSSGLGLVMLALCTLVLIVIVPDIAAQSRDKASRKSNSSPQAQVSLVDMRLESATNAAGQPVTLVVIDWRNVGSVPVRAVYADITGYDANGVRLANSARDYCVYAAPSASSPGIPPGQIYREPNSDGFMFSHVFGAVDECRVHITRATEKVEGP